MHVLVEPWPHKVLMGPLDVHTQSTLCSLMSTECVHNKDVWTALDASDVRLMSTWSRLHDLYAYMLMGLRFHKGRMGPLDTRTRLTLGSLIPTGCVYQTVFLTVLDASEAL